MKLIPDLPSVTLCAVDCLNPSLALRALDICRLQCNFGEVLFLTDKTDGLQMEGCRMERIERIGSVAAYSRFVLKELRRFCRTEHVLLVQWDGYIINPQSWRPEFLEYDYIGAPWGWYQDSHRVGNGGFSLRSRKLLDALLDEQIVDLEPEDEAIGRRYRLLLEEKYQIRFAPDEIAEAFSYETISPKGRPFGFHGLFHMWSILPQQQLAGFVASLAPSSVTSLQYFQLCKNYVELGCRNEASFLLRRRLEVDPDDAGSRELLAAINSQGYGIPPAPQIPARNDPCPCNSGKRYKQCCGAFADTGLGQESRDKVEKPWYLLFQAKSHHHAGRLNEAEAIYRRILEREPNNAEVLQYLGILSMQRGEKEKGLQLIRQALDMRAFIVDFQVHLAKCLELHGRLDEAQECYKCVIGFRPDFVPAPGNTRQA